MAHPSTYPIDELLECRKGLVLQIQNHRSSMTQGNSTVSKRSPSAHNAPLFPLTTHTII